MKTKAFPSTAPKFSLLQGLAVVIQTGTQSEILASLKQFQAKSEFQGTGWQAAFSKLETVFSTGIPQFKIFAKGNSKLPFYAFSTLPGVTCPGAGDCIDFCYSFRAWRYPSAFARQCQNAWLLRFGTDTVSRDLFTLSEGKPEGFDLRLYVDGDFSSIGDVIFWMSLLNCIPQIKAYGYSKSFALLLAFDLVGHWPKNYMLNISSGHNASPSMVEYIKALPITRGEFIAVAVGFKPVHGSPATNAAIRALVPSKVFPCPGRCGSCTGSGHACGLPQMKGRVIAIALH